MMEKNFRSNYYEKVGFKSIDIKKSLETILTEEIIDKPKLAQFVLKYEVPVQFRARVWMVLLGVVSCNKVASSFVWQQRSDQYNVLLQALRTMRYLPPEAGSDVEEVRWRMASILALEENRLPWKECTDAACASDSVTRRRAPIKPWCDPDFDVVFNLVHESALTEDDTETYWLCRNLYKMVVQRKSLLKAQVKEIESYVARHDAELAVHLEKGSVWKWPPALPVLVDLLRLAFAGVFQFEPVLRLWDKIIAGCALCEVFVLAEVILLHRSSLLTTPTSLVLEKIGHIFREIPFVNQHALIDRAFETWQIDFGGVLQPNLVAPVTATSFATASNALPVGAVSVASAPSDSKQKIPSANQSAKPSLQRKLSHLVKL